VERCDRGSRSHDGEPGTIEGSKGDAMSACDAIAAGDAPARHGSASTQAEAEQLLGQFETMPLAALLASARALRLTGHGRVISYSRKVFIPLTRLCRDACGYCTFALSPRQAGDAYLAPEQVLAIARAGRTASCHEALFTLGDRPERRYAAARSALKRLGHESTISYLGAMCELVMAETGLLPHINAGIMTAPEIAALRRVSVSQGIMLESVSPRLSEPGGPHFGAPDKDPSVRLAMIEAAGRERVPFTTGILIGIGETRLERIQSLLALRDLNARYGHLQEVIIQNFHAKPGTRMARAAEPSLEDLLWTAAVARLVLGPTMNLQVPPNLSFEAFARLMSAGINDWGGVSPVTPDHVNPEAPWPQLERLAHASAEAGLTLTERLAVYPEYALAASRWLDPALTPRVLAEIDATGFVREDPWVPGASGPFNLHRRAPRRGGVPVTAMLDRAIAGDRLNEDEIVRLFAARGPEVDEVAAAADSLRAKVNGDIVTYVVNRNINYTNVCRYACGFCAFSKGKLSDHLRGRPYDLALEEIARRTLEAWQRGATEVCLQGGIHPSYTGDTYLTVVRTVLDAAPSIHVHAFSPLEIMHGAGTLGISVHAFLERLKAAGLGTLPGTAAEILDDAVRAVICPDKLTTRQWLDVVAAAHAVGLPTTATIMFGHVETPRAWAAHLLKIRDLQQRTGGITEFVPLPFVHMEAPIYLKGKSRRGPTWRETLLMHALARLVLHPLVTNIQASWVKLGTQGLAEMLNAGVNDCGGTLMNESISRAAGTQHGQELPPQSMEAAISNARRLPRQRTTLYRPVEPDRQRLSFAAPALRPVVQTPIGRRAPRVEPSQEPRR
jgi:FO synthase